MPFPLIPMLLGAAALVVAVASGGKRKARATPPTAGPSAGPIETRSGYAAAKRQFDFAMSPGVKDPEYLRNIAEALGLGGFPELAADILEKVESLPAGGVPASVPPGTTPPAAPPAPPPVTLPAETTEEEGEIEVEPAPAEAEGAIEEEEPPDGVPRAETAPMPAAPPPAVVPASAIPPVARAETEAAVDPFGTILLARMLISREGGPAWKTDLQPEVKAWQLKRGLSGDGKFGTGSAIKMGEEVGTLPRIRFFSTKFWQKDTAVADAKARIRALADLIQPTNAPHATALRVSADAENGQGWPAQVAAVPTNQREIEADQLRQALELMAREKAAGEAEAVDEGSVPDSPLAMGTGTRTTEYA